MRHAKVHQFNRHLLLEARDLCLAGAIESILGVMRPSPALLNNTTRRQTTRIQCFGLPASQTLSSPEPFCIKFRRFFFQMARAARLPIRFIPRSFCAVIFQLLSFISQFNSAGSFCASPSSVLPSQNRLFLSILLRCRLLLRRRRRRRDYAVARFRKKMNYLFVRPPPKRRGEVNAIELALPPRNLRRVTHLYTQVRQDRSLALIADCGREREEEEGAKTKLHLPPSTFITSAGEKFACLGPCRAVRPRTCSRVRRDFIES